MGTTTIKTIDNPSWFIVRKGSEEYGIDEISFRAFFDDGDIHIPLADATRTKGNNNITAERKLIRRTEIPVYDVEGIHIACMCITLDEFIEMTSKSRKTEGKLVHKWLVGNKELVIETCVRNVR